MDNIAKEDFSLSKEIFNIKVNTQAIFDTIMSERASKRQGTHKTKTRGEVRGGGKKPFAQKHTGRARAGSTRSPIWVGGGTVFGPTNNKNYNLKVNKKVKKLAYKSALTLKAKSNSISLINISIDKISTKNLIQNLKDNKINTNKKILILSSDEILFKSSNNLKNIVVQKISGLLVEQIIHADILIFSKNNLQELERFSK